MSAQPAPHAACLARVTVKTASSRYPILIGEGLLGSAAALDGLRDSSQALIVSNARVAALYAQPLRELLQARHRQVHLLELPEGEEHKTLASLNLVFDALLSRGCDRKTTLYALGGGVVGDLTGFAAACYMRGVPFVQVPTTLLAQVDSSVGGKTAVNHPLGKNMIGAFHQPELVLADLATLRSLPARELSAGLAEVIKYGPIADFAFFEWLEAHLDKLLALDVQALAYAVQRCCEIKAEVVGEDERESGRRAILNFGHTFGHAIEAGLGYGQWLHGEAVAAGMVAATRLSARLGGVDVQLEDRLTRLLLRAGLPTRLPAAIGAERFLELMRLDKKSVSGQMQYVVLEAPGRAGTRSAPDSDVARLITELAEKGV
jgi:3-dehydroquinate synthase